MKLSHLHESDEEYRRLTKHPGEMSEMDHYRASRENPDHDYGHGPEHDWVNDQIKLWHNRHVNNAPPEELSAILDNILKHFENYDFSHAPNELIEAVQWAQGEKIAAQQERDLSQLNEIPGTINNGEYYTPGPEADELATRLYGPDNFGEMSQEQYDIDQAEYLARRKIDADPAVQDRKHKADEAGLKTLEKRYPFPGEH